MTTHRRDIPALPDLVFAAAVEPQRLADWLPPPLDVVGLAEDDILILRHQGRLTQVRLAADFDHLRLTWESLADPTRRGALTVSPLGAGHSVAELEVEPDDQEFAGRLLDALAKEVEATFTAG
ncbi:SRPBCC family protein [Saccharothrix sp.]|uniref:SRPBCC family protein n=1 Tax=Saccharothrix sp. TaxID=1873460 RepID=UPI0028121A87|nr:SRPBCC family protein [Saccharothrix sp.]